MFQRKTSFDDESIIGSPECKENKTDKRYDIRVDITISKKMPQDAYPEGIYLMECFLL